MKITLELTRDQHGRPVVLATLEGGWPTTEECHLTAAAYHRGATDCPEPPAAPYFGGDPRRIAGTAAAALLGGGAVRSPVDEIPDDLGALTFRGGPVTR